MAAQSATGNTVNPRLRATCAKLAEVISKYLTEDELRELAAIQMEFAWAVARTRYLPGLVDATYDAFAASNLRRED